MILEEYVWLFKIGEMENFKKSVKFFLKGDLQTFMCEKQTSFNKK